MEERWNLFVRETPGWLHGFQKATKVSIALEVGHQAGETSCWTNPLKVIGSKWAYYRHSLETLTIHQLLPGDALKLPVCRRCLVLTIPWAAMRAARVLLPEVPGVQSERRTSCPPTSVRSMSISTASACSALSYSTTPKPRTGLPSSWASYKGKKDKINSWIKKHKTENPTLSPLNDVEELGS